MKMKANKRQSATEKNLQCSAKLEEKLEGKNGKEREIWGQWTGSRTAMTEENGTARQELTAGASLASVWVGGCRTSEHFVGECQRQERGK